MASLARGGCVDGEAPWVCVEWWVHEAGGVMGSADCYSTAAWNDHHLSEGVKEISSLLQLMGVYIQTGHDSNLDRSHCNYIYNINQLF